MYFKCKITKNRNIFLKTEIKNKLALEREERGNKK